MTEITHDTTDPHLSCFFLNTQCFILPPCSILPRFPLHMQSFGKGQSRICKKKVDGYFTKGSSTRRCVMVFIIQHFHIRYPSSYSSYSSLGRGWPDSQQDLWHSGEMPSYVAIQMYAWTRNRRWYILLSSSEFLCLRITSKRPCQNSSTIPLRDTHFICTSIVLHLTDCVLKWLKQLLGDTRRTVCICTKSCKVKWPCEALMSQDTDHWQANLGPRAESWKLGPLITKWPYRQWSLEAATLGVEIFMQLRNYATALNVAPPKFWTSFHPQMCNCLHQR